MNNINFGQSKSMNSLQQVAKNSKTHEKQNVPRVRVKQMAHHT